MSLTVKTLSGTDLSLSPDDLNAFEARLQGELVLKDHPQFEESRTIWNAMIDRHPALVVRCRGTADVVECVNFARERDILITMKGGGHNIAGLSVADGAMMLDMSLMRGVWVDKKAGIAHAQAGCLLGDVDRETQLHGLAAVLGFVSNTGIAGLTLGGGFGYLSRKYGWTSDNVTGIDMVTADGRQVRAGESENADLFWGLRGGGGNFGVATGFDYKLYPLGPEVFAGAVAWPADQAPEVLKLYREITADAPVELSCVAVMRIAPPAPWLAQEIHGKPIVAIFAIHSGSITDGQKLLAPVKGFGQPVGDILQPRPYNTQQTILDATQPKGRRYYWKSEYLPEISEAIITKYLDHAARIVSPHSAVIFFPLGGALSDLPEDHSAVGNRDAKFVFNATASWESADDDAANVGWARTAWEDMRAFSTGGTYLNFLTEDEDNTRTQNAFRGNYDKLIDIKSKWDPSNFFRTNKNIAPR